MKAKQQDTNNSDINKLRSYLQDFVTNQGQVNAQILSRLDDITLLINAITNIVNNILIHFSNNNKN